MSKAITSLTGLLNVRAWKSRLPISGTFELSPQCNLDCNMCYIRKTAEQIKMHDRPILSLDQWKRLADEIFEAGTLHLLLTGGEPFLWEEFQELYEYVHMKGFLVSINSNGTMIDERTVAWLKKYPPTRINISLYGASDETYKSLCNRDNMYSRVAENIDRLVQEGIPVKINCSLTPDNAADLEKIVDFAKQRDLMIDVATYMYPPVRRDTESIGTGNRFTPKEAAKYALKFRSLMLDKPQYIKVLEEAVEGSIASVGFDEACVDAKDGEVKCMAGRGSYWITWDGYMLPCGMVPEPKEDVTKLGFQQAWNNIVTQINETRLSGVCKDCDSKKICHACMAMAITETGSHGGIPSYLCQMADEIRIQAKELLKGEIGGEL